jgi:D-amino-acid dehydrogenase
MAGYETVVVGGGIVGTSVAYHLARAGVETVVFDRRDEGRATDAGAGILAPATSSRTGSDPWFAFAAEAVGYYPELVARLRDEGDGDTGYAQCGLLSVAFTDSEVEAFEAAGERVRERADRAERGPRNERAATEGSRERADCPGRPDPDAVADLGPGEARDRFPVLGEPRRARFYEGAARVNGATFTAAMRRAAEEYGLTVERRSVERVVVEDGETRGVEVDGERVDAGSVVVAGGAWSSAFADDLGVSIPVEPLRGQIAHLRADRDTDGWPIVTGFRDHYLVPWPDGRVAAGATREADAGFAPRATAGGVREVLDEALRVAPGLSDAELAEVRVGLRPASADRLPVLGPVPGVEGAFLATGHGATGLQLGPYSGRVVASMVRGEEHGVDVSAFRVERFG